MRKWVGRVLVCGSFAVSIILTFYSAKYSFNNPDPQAYYVEGTDETEPQLVPTADVNVDGVVPIHGLYDLWFKLMFASMVLFYFVFFGIWSHLKIDFANYFLSTVENMVPGRKYGTF